METAIAQLRSALDVLEQNAALIPADNFPARADILDAIESDVLERIDQMSGASGEVEDLRVLRRRAHVLRSSLEGVNQRLFERLRLLIKSGAISGRQLERQLRGYARHVTGNSHPEDIGYDSLDAFISGLILLPPPPEETRVREPDMVYYQPTPVRVILDLVGKARFSPGDVFYDLGSGLGQVAIVVNLLTGVAARGVEYEPAYCAYAQRCASELGLSQVQFVNADAREANLTDGTVFYLYTPFEGRMLSMVLRRLKSISHVRSIRLLSYGPCTAVVAGQNWLISDDGPRFDPLRLSVFHSAPI